MCPRVKKVVQDSLGTAAFAAAGAVFFLYRLYLRKDLRLLFLRYILLEPNILVVIRVSLVLGYIKEQDVMTQ